MTKLRPPLSFHQAIDRIGGRIGWEKAGEICGVGARAARNWSDPDTPALPSLDDALKLDLAYRRDGAGEAPILAVFAQMLERELEAPADSEILAAVTARAAKEGGEAIAAMVMAAQPGAGRHARAAATREVQEAIASLTDAAAKLGDPDLTPAAPRAPSGP